MKSGRKILGFAGAIAALVTAPVLANNADNPPNPFAVQLLDLHNEERTNTGVPSLRWSGKLAIEAQQWADQLAREGRMRHASHDVRRGAGENLWRGSAGYYDADQMMGAFIAEKQHYKHADFPNVSRTGRWADVGHYTQIVWRDTQEVGCAVARNDRDDFLVCRYWPAGNMIGRKAY